MSNPKTNTPFLRVLILSPESLGRVAEAFLGLLQVSNDDISKILGVKEFL